MKITAIIIQAKNANRVNVSVDGSYRFSLDVYQVADLGVRIGKEYTEEDLAALLDESTFGKVYSRALEYSLTRPHSAKEIRDYLYKKTRDARTKTGEVKKGVSSDITQRVFDRLVQKGYIDDEKFARFWVENRNVRKGVSVRKLTMELRAKGVPADTIEHVLGEAGRSDGDELQKVIAKKSARYADDQKLMQYLVRQGFSYDDVKKALSKED